MKRVIKGTEPTSFTQWKALENSDWQPDYSILRDPQKRDLLDALLEEQGFLCCYCGREIDASSSHIEHFRPQDRYSQRALQFNNLHASCIRETQDRLPEHPLHCGHKKSNWFEEDSHIAPIDEQCEQRFRYLINGEIKAALPSDTPASKMIEVLALDISYLNNRRRAALRAFFDEDFLNTVTEDELRQAISALRPAQANAQGAFEHVLARFAEQQLPD